MPLVIGPSPGPAGAAGAPGPANLLGGTYAARPAAGTASRIYVVQDGPIPITWDDGANWRPVLPAAAGLGMQPSAAASWTLLQTAANFSVADDNGAVKLVGTARVAPGNEDTGIIVKAAPATPYDIQAAFVPNLDSNLTARLGLVLYETASTKCVQLSIYCSGATGLVSTRRLGRYGRTGLTGAPAALTEQSGMGAFGNLWFVRVTDDGVNRKFYYSIDGRTWQLFVSEARATGFTAAPDKIGFSVDAAGVAGTLELVHLVGL